MSMARGDIGGGPPLGVNVGVATVLVLRENPYRKKATFTNDSISVIYLSKSDTAILNCGIRLNANGGAIVDEPDRNMYIYTGPWYAISTAANMRLCVQEN